MKRPSPLVLTAAAFMILPTAQALAQTVGVSHPELLDETPSAAAPTPDSAHYAKPSPAVPLASASAPALQVHADAASDDHYVPYHPGTTASVQEQATAHSELSAPHPIDRTLVVTNDINSGIVTEVPAGPNQLAPGTVMKASLQEAITTRETLAGTKFTAALLSDVGHGGRVLLPAGSVVHGRITQIHGGRRIGGNAAIRLQPDFVILPDGTSYKLNAEVIDLDNYRDSHVNGEGVIVANGHAKATAAALSLTTGSAVIAGAMIGGGVGAVVGLGVGAGVGAIWWLKQDRQEVLPHGTQIAFSLNDSLFVGTAN